MRNVLHIDEFATRRSYTSYKLCRFVIKGPFSVNSRKWCVIMWKGNRLWKYSRGGDSYFCVFQRQQRTFFSWYPTDHWPYERMKAWWLAGLEETRWRPASHAFEAKQGVRGRPMLSRPGSREGKGVRGRPITAGWGGLQWAREVGGQVLLARSEVAPGPRRPCCIWATS